MKVTVAARRIVGMSVRLIARHFAAAVFASVSEADASSLPRTAQQQRARASVIFDGAALDNRTGTGVQRFRASHYPKGDRPQIVRVSAGARRRRVRSRATREPRLTPTQADVVRG